MRWILKAYRPFWLAFILFESANSQPLLAAPDTHSPRLDDGWEQFEPVQDLPVLKSQIRPDLPFEALGPRAGIWGNTSEGLEAWAYPFKLFDHFSIQPDSDGADVRAGTPTHARSQINTPFLAQRQYAGEKWSLKETWFVPRTLPALVLLISEEGATSQGTGLRFRPSLAPMFLDRKSPLVFTWDPSSNIALIDETNRQVTLAMSIPLGFLPEFDGEWVMLKRSNNFKMPDHLSPVIFAASWQGGPDVSATLEAIRKEPGERLREAVSHYRSLLAQAPDVQTPDMRFNQGLQWSVVSLDQLRIENPFLGPGLVSGYGSSHGGNRPRYCWFFEEPTLASWAYHRAGLTSHVREALRFLQRFQRADGKTVHEVSQSLRFQPDYFQSYPFAYMHSDGPVYYLAAYGQYFRETGDSTFIHEQWPHILKTIQWCFTMVDVQDGLLRIHDGDWGSAESSTGVWKDTQLEAMWIRALKDTAMLAQIMGDGQLLRRCKQAESRASQSLETSFWNPQEGVYDWGLDRKNQRLASLVPHHSIGFWLAGLNSARVRQNLCRMAQSDFRTDWGTRSLAQSDPKYDEANYQSGSVWPVWNAGVIISDYRHGRAIDAFRNLQAMFELRTTLTLGSMPEVLSGRHCALLSEAVPHQMFSELAVMNGFFDGMLGLEVNAPEKQLGLSPQLCVAWPYANIRRIPVGSARMDLFLTNHWNSFVMNVAMAGSQEYALTHTAVLPPGAMLQSVRWRGQSVSYIEESYPWGRAARIALPLNQGGLLEVFHEGGIQFLIKEEPLAYGETSHRLRLWNWDFEASIFTLTLEGLPGRTYTIDWFTRRELSSVNGARSVPPVSAQARTEIEFDDAPAKPHSAFRSKTVTLEWSP